MIVLDDAGKAPPIKCVPFLFSFLSCSSADVGATICSCYTLHKQSILLDLALAAQRYAALPVFNIFTCLLTNCRFLPLETFQTVRDVDIFFCD